MADSSSPRAFWRESERDIWGDTNMEFYYAPVDGARGKKINKMNVNKVRYSVFLFRRNKFVSRLNSDFVCLFQLLHQVNKTIYLTFYLFYIVHVTVCK